MIFCCRPKVERKNSKIQPEDIKTPQVQKTQSETQKFEPIESQKTHNLEPTGSESPKTHKVTDKKDKDIELIPIAQATIKETTKMRDEYDRPPPPRSFAGETQKKVVVVKPKEEGEFEIKYKHGDASSNFQSSFHPFGSSGE
jgi:hypothetical protein